MARNRDMRCLLVLRRRGRTGDARARRRFGDRDFRRRPGERFSRPRRGDWLRDCAPKLTMSVCRTSSASILLCRVTCQRTKIISTLAAIAITTPILESVQTSNGYARSIGSCVYHLSFPKYLTHITCRIPAVEESHAEYAVEPRSRLHPHGEDPMEECQLRRDCRC